MFLRCGEIVQTALCDRWNGAYPTLHTVSVCLEIYHERKNLAKITERGSKYVLLSVDISHIIFTTSLVVLSYNDIRGADKSLARPGREKVTSTEDFECHISYL